VVETMMLQFEVFVGMTLEGEKKEIILEGRERE
jgi:hypothetical protein